MRQSKAAAYTFDELVTIAREHPEFGRVEILHGNLFGAGDEVASDRHQGVVQQLYEALIPMRPAEFVIRLDTYWFVGDSRLRPDIAVWHQSQRPSDGGGFRHPPVWVAEVVGRHDGDDMQRKHAIYAAHGVSTCYVDPFVEHGWWLHDGADAAVAGPTHTITIPGWQPLELTDAILTG